MLLLHPVASATTTTWTGMVRVSTQQRRLPTRRAMLTGGAVAVNPRGARAATRESTLRRGVLHASGAPRTLVRGTGGCRGSRRATSRSVRAGKRLRGPLRGNRLWCTIHRPVPEEALFILAEAGGDTDPTPRSRGRCSVRGTAKRHPPRCFEQVGEGTCAAYRTWRRD